MPDWAKKIQPVYKDRGPTSDRMLFYCPVQNYGSGMDNTDSGIFILGVKYRPCYGDFSFAFLDFSSGIWSRNSSVSMGDH